MHSERNFNISFTEMKEILLEFSLSENFTKCFSESPDHLVVFFTSLIFDCVSAVLIWYLCISYLYLLFKQVFKSKNK